MSSSQTFDTIVIGAGHAGIEAGLAVARAGYQVLVLTMEIDAIGKMSCNPSIGGIAKGHMVREIDALGGQMGLAIDTTGIQFRMLNQSKGPAVWAPRAQADKKQYQRYMRQTLENEKNLLLKQAQVTRLLVRKGQCYGVRTVIGEEFLSKTVIVTTGTFLCGMIHIGNSTYPSGRDGEQPAVGLSDSLRENGIELVRFKTGTPPRLHARSIHWKTLEEQKGDENPRAFSYRTKHLNIDQLSCYITYTSAKTHDIIRKNLDRAPLYTGQISGIGPRYCPSIEVKVVKFPDKSRHQIFLEPEGRNTNEIYVNGFSTSLPHEVQHEMIHSTKGLEDAEIIRLGYAIEYDCAPPTQLKHSLETKRIENLFFAGQINCTSGYEEAAAQGLMAGFNVIRKLQDKPPFVLDRSEAYIGVMIDDLVTLGTPEPYRMFTSRAEFRLLLRQDNADERLMHYGFNFGLISSDQFDLMKASLKKIRDEAQYLRSYRYGQHTWRHILRRPENSYKTLIHLGLRSYKLNDDEIHKLETEIKYEGYINRQKIEVEKLKKIEKKKIPQNLDYEKIHGIRSEAKEKLSFVRPTSIAQASRIPGISPCDVAILAVHLRTRTSRN